MVTSTADAVITLQIPYLIRKDALLTLERHNNMKDGIPFMNVLRPAFTLGSGAAAPCSMGYAEAQQKMIASSTTYGGEQPAANNIKQTSAKTRIAPHTTFLH